MTYATTLAAILVHATAAGASLTPPIEDVKIGWPVPRGRCIRIFYNGETEPVRMGGNRTLAADLVSEVTSIVAFWPVNDASDDNAQNIETQMVALKHDLRTRICGDGQLSGSGTDLELGYVEPDFQVISGARYRVMAWDLTTDTTAYPLAQ